jgi:dTDP-4-dehydrorhamnose reductase
MNVVLTGAAGQLGQELWPQLAPLGRIEAFDRVALPGERQVRAADLSDLNRVEIMLNRSLPDLVVNAAAYTAVDRAEDEPEAAFRVNAELPGCLARWAARNDRALVHYSTDYVFDGNGDSPYAEGDQTGPLNVYGESKLAGEWAIQNSGCRHLILRTSWVYSGHGNNFVLTMLRLARERSSLSVVSDQVGCPTWACNLARVTRQMIDILRADKASDKGTGILHYCDANPVSWFEFARMIFTGAVEAGLLHRVPQMTPVASSDFPQKAERPRYSVLDTSVIQEDFGIEAAGLLPSLQSCLEGIARDEP